MRAEPDLVNYTFGALRTSVPNDTLRRLAPLLRPAGITRVADLTGLDFLGIPVYQAVRPNSRNLSVSQGKGVTRSQAKVSALMESLESFHAERIDQPRVVATARAMASTLAYDPNLLLRPTTRRLPTDVAFEWIQGSDLSSGHPTWVPTQLCELDAVINGRLARLDFVATSNGLASGNTICEAVLHSLCELVERDAAWRGRHRRWDPTHALAPGSVTSHLARRFLDRYVRLGFRLYVHVLRSPTGLPCFEAFINSDDFPSSLFYGAGCSPRRSVALLRALTEAAQSRVTYIAGARDDLARRVYSSDNAASGELRSRFAGADGMVSYRHIPQLPVRGLPSTVEEVVALAQAVSGHAPVAVDLARPEFGLPVVKVVLPGMEARRYGDLES